jgi:6-phosphofructokinase 2
MTVIITMTLNPAIDVGYEVDRVFPTHKMRTINEHYDPGGGGINVARVLARLGATVHCLYFSGGPTGIALDGLLDSHFLPRMRIAITGPTRVSTMMFDRSTGHEYRLVPPGPVVKAEEWQACIDRLEEISCDMLVASGSLPPGVPDDFYAQVAKRLRARGIAFVLDSSGRGLAQGLSGGGVLLVKPSLGELRQLCGKPLEDEPAIAAAAMELVRNGSCEHVAVTMGDRGALLAGRDGCLRLPAIAVKAKSTVGAGDSFLAAMVFALTQDKPVEEAFRFAIAAGAAALLSPGTGLAHPADIDRLRPLIADGNACVSG